MAAMALATLPSSPSLAFCANATCFVEKGCSRNRVSLKSSLLRRLQRLCPESRFSYGPALDCSRRRGAWRSPSALFGDKGGGEGKKDEKKFITKEQEPEQYWQTADEKDGKNPMQSPLAYMAILGLLTPFAILAVAFANNWIKIPVR